MENVDDIEMNNIDREDESTEINEETSDTLFIRPGIRPGHFTYDILQNKFGMMDVEIDAANRSFGGVYDGSNEQFIDTIIKNKNLSDYAVKYAFKSGNMASDFEIIKPVIDKLVFRKRGDGKMLVLAKVKGNLKNFFVMDKNGDIETFNKNGTLYVNQESFKARFNIDYVSRFGFKAEDVLDIQVAKMEEILDKGNLNIPDYPTNIPPESIPMLDTAKIDQLDELDRMNDYDDEEEEINDDGTVTTTFIDDVTMEKISLKNKILSIVRKSKKSRYKELLTNNRVFEDMEELKEQLPLKYRLKMIFKEHGITIASLTLAVGSIITSIATSLAGTATTLKGVNKLKNEVKELKKINEELKKSGEDVSDKIDKNDKEIKDKLDEIEGKKSLVDYIKQVASFILSSSAALIKFIGSLVKYLGKTMIGFGWVIYVIIAAMAALAYGYYEK